MTKAAPDPLDELYAAPLAEFIATRGRLSADLRKAGDKQGAADIKTAVKPSASAWAVNQAVRRAPEALGRLLEASDALREAQLKAGGGESRERYQEAVAEHRRAVDALVDEAEKALTEGGQKASPDLRERIAGNLRWAPQSAESRQLLEAGRLTKDVGPQDFGALLGSARSEGGGAKVIPLHRPSPTAPAKHGGGAAPAQDSGDSKAERAAEAERKREAERQRREQLAEARAELRTRRQEAERARKQQEKARADRERGEARVAELEESLAEAKKALAAAREEEKKGAVELHRAERNLQGADAAVGELEQE
jgi:hypothetical protein